MVSRLGTSQSSKGPLSNVSLVPPWVDDIEKPADAPADETLPGLAPPAPPQDPIAQPRRFAAARSDIGSFAKTGNSSSMRRGLGHYVREGYGGSGTFTRRLSGTARTASALDSLLGRGVLPDGTSLADQTLASGGDVNVVLDAVVDAVREPDGTQDAESSRRSIRTALSELLDRYPDAELGALTPDQRSFVIERYASLDVTADSCSTCRRLSARRRATFKPRSPVCGRSRHSSTKPSLRRSERLETKVKQRRASRL